MQLFGHCFGLENQAVQSSSSAHQHQLSKRQNISLAYTFFYLA